MPSREVKVAIIGDARRFGQAVSEADGHLGRLGGSFKKFAGLAAGAVAGVGIASIGKGLYDAAIESQKVTKQTEAVLKSMGDVAGVTSKQVADLSTKLSMQTGIDDELIQSAENVLLTFGKVRNEAGKGNDIFTRTTKAAVDMSVALGTDLKGATIQLGKAMNDPVKGMTALTRSGVSFTQQQKDQVKALVESGRTLDAQKLILSEVEKQFKGSAAAQATAGEKLKVVWGNLQETLGAKLLPIVEKFSTFLATNLQPTMDKVGQFISRHKEPIIALAAAIGGALVTAFGAWAISAATAAAATIAAMAPVIALGAAIAAVAGAFVWAYRNVDIFHDAVNAIAGFFTDILIPTIAGFLSFLTDHWRGILQILTGPIGVAVGIIAGHFGGIYDAVKTVVEKVLSIGKGIWDWVVGGLKGLVNSALGILEGLINGIISAINAAIRAYNKLPFAPNIGTIDHVKLGKVSDGPKSVGEDAKRKLHEFGTGGVIPGPRGMPTPILAHAGETVLPTHKPGWAGALGGSTYVLNVTVNDATDPRRVVEAIEQAVKAGTFFGPATQRQIRAA